MRYEPTLEPTVRLDPAKAYLYGRFRLNPGSQDSPRLAMDLTCLDNGQTLSVAFNRAGEEHYLIEVPPGRYQFTHLLLASTVAALGPVKRAPLELPPRAGVLGTPFTVVAGKAYYVGDYVGVVSREMSEGTVPAAVKTAWGLYRASFDYDGATAEMKQRYPSLGPVETVPAWKLRPRPRRSPPIEAGLPAGAPTPVPRAGEG
ncbi:MAG: hypothetical protein L0027_04345 [Candidatus Rokubacteria bacterium]|nr:hypothetical protein [Candidatus Rokubacteria bacterium]